MSAKAKQEPETWRDRLIEVRKMRAGDVLPHPLNPKTHPPAQTEPLAALLREVGKVDTLRAYYSERNDGKLTYWDGHARDNLNQDELWNVAIYDIHDSEADKLVASFDPLASLAEMESAKLEVLLQNISTGEPALQQMLAELAAESGLTYGTQEPAQAPEPEIDRAAELLEKWKVERGQLWEIGGHRLLCGDSTNADDVARVMNQECAILLVTDPPYNVNIDYGENVDDSKIEADYEAFSRAWFSLWAAASDRQIVTPGCNNLARWCRYFEAYHVAPWTKTNSMTNGKVARWWCWEPVMFFGGKWKRERSNDVFDFPIGEQGGVANHPCPKPLKMWSDLIENYSDRGNLIADAFCGAGTSIVAAEQLGRRCNAMELEPKWASVTLERMFQMTGKTPLLADRVTQQTYTVHSTNA